jgi:hypothetical protein
MTYSYIYLLQDGKDKGTKVYKVGRTEQNCNDSRKLARLQDYSKGTIVYNTFCVPKCRVRQIECEIKTTFSLKYKLYRGSEWFEGNVISMKKDIDKIIDNFCKQEEENTDDEDIDIECIACQDTGNMYYGDDVYGPCLNCDVSQRCTGIHNIVFKTKTDARWASMFDNFGWSWEYAPVWDSSDYSPDFFLSFEGVKVWVDVLIDDALPDTLCENIKYIHEAGWKGYFLVLANNYQVCNYKSSKHTDQIKIGVGGSINGFPGQEIYKDDFTYASVDGQMATAKKWHPNDFDYRKFRPLGFRAFVKKHHGVWFLEFGGGHYENYIPCALGNDINAFDYYYKRAERDNLRYLKLSLDECRLQRGITDEDCVDTFQKFWNKNIHI